VLPSLSPLSGDVLAGDVVQVPAPPRFRGVGGTPHDVEINRDGKGASGTTLSQKAGVRYEVQAQYHLLTLFPDLYLSPSVRFIDEGGDRICIPDAVLCEERDIFIFEIKLTHVPEAWWQLHRLYKPVLEELPGNRRVHCVEVCRSYDPSMPFPCRVEVIDDLGAWMQDRPTSFGVYPWKA